MYVKDLLMTDAVHFPQMPPKKKSKKSLDFEPRVDHMPDFLKALDELVTLYEKQDDFRAKSFKKAKESLEGQIITSVDDIKLFKLSELDGVGKGTLECLKEFIETNTIQRLEELRAKVSDTKEAVDYNAFWEAAKTDLRKALTLLPEKDSVSVTDDGKLMVNAIEKEGFGCQGCPFTFEYKGDTYKVDGTVDVNAMLYGGDISFDGTITKNTEDPVNLEVECEVEVSDCVDFQTPQVNCDTKALGFTEEDEEDFLIFVGQEILDEVFDNYGGEWQTPE